MAPKKSIKETVVYPASKTKAPPFKPLRPSNPSQASRSGSTSAIPKTTNNPPPVKRRKIAPQDDDESDSDQLKEAPEDDSDASDDLPANPLRAKQYKSTKRPTPKRRPARDVSPMSVSSEEASETLRNRPMTEPDPPPGPSQSDTIPSIPQPLLVRLLHEHFADKATKIDKNAIQVLERYFEVFIRETIARAKLRKQEEAEANGTAYSVDASWLEMEDLEKVAAGMMLDF